MMHNLFRILRQCRSYPGILIALTACPLSVLVNAQPFSEAGDSPTQYSAGNIAPGMSCQAIENLALHDVIAISAESVPASDGVPAYCEVNGTIDPEITFQVNLPASWNSRFYMIGNGGHAGDQPGSPFQAPLRSEALSHHFVMASTDTGHNSSVEPGASFVMSNPQKAIDYAYRAVHVTAVTAKAIANAYYGQPVDFSYWNSCSNGGRQGMLEAQRYPADFDGIVANAPWVDQTGFTLGALWNQQAFSETPVSAAKMSLVAENVMAKCDAIDGLEDGLIDDPRNCSIQVSQDVPACPAGADNDSCLTPAQAEAIQKVYDGPRNSNGEQIFPGFMPGSEALTQGFGGGPAASSWMGLIVPGEPGAGTADFGLANDTMRYLAFQPPRPDWDYQDFDFDRDVELLDRWSRLADATDTNLGDFRANGGKLIMTYGWADTILQPMMGVNYYEQAVTANGPDGDAFMRLFMVPGMSHCAGGNGPDQNDALSAVINWVEAGVAPDRLIARKIEDGEVTRSRPLCPYPEVARYDGSGSIDDAANFQCAAP